MNRIEDPSNPEDARSNTEGSGIKEGKKVWGGGKQASQQNKNIIKQNKPTHILFTIFM